MSEIIDTILIFVIVAPSLMLFLAFLFSITE